MSVGLIQVRNVEWALRSLVTTDISEWRDISPRGLRTMEHPGPFITEYERPQERVLFCPIRNANPFFHLMEAMWILAGRDDVKFLTRYNPRMADFSDNGDTFHAPYGYRLRRHFGRMQTIETGIGMMEEWCGLDQIAIAIKLLKADNRSRQVVLSIWDPESDLGTRTKDMPCNDTICLKVRDGGLQMTVLCRSNDAIWGAYGANAVQFSVLQEFIASAVGVEIGRLVQISDSFHVYTDNEAWKRLDNYYTNERPRTETTPPNYYARNVVAPFPLFSNWTGNWESWLKYCEMFCEGGLIDNFAPAFIREVAMPVRIAWDHYKHGDVEAALNVIEMEMPTGCDWQVACEEWLKRRQARGDK